MIEALAADPALCKALDWVSSACVGPPAARVGFELIFPSILEENRLNVLMNSGFSPLRTSTTALCDRVGGPFSHLDGECGT